MRKLDLDRFWYIICGIDHMESIVEVLARYAICLFVVCCTFGSCERHHRVIVFRAGSCTGAYLSQLLADPATRWSCRQA